MESIKVVIISEDTSIRVNLKKKLADRDIQIVGYADFKDESRLKIDGLFPDVVIVGVKVPIDPEVFSFVESMKFQSKGCAAVVATDDVTVDLVNYAARFGIRQVLPLDMKDNEFYSRVVQVNEYEKVIQAQLNIQKRVRSKVIAFFGCKGGTGKSVMATNLAVALSKRGSNVILLDMDLRFGDQNILLDLEPKDTIVELAQDPEGISIERVNSFSIMHSSGVVLLAAPKSPEYAEYIKPEHVTKVIRSVRPYYEYVIVDLGTNFSDETIAALQECDEIMIVNNPDILSLKAAKSAVDEAYSNYDSVDASTRQSVESAQNTIDMEKYSQETDTSSKTQLESLRKQLQECTITCQADGIVTAVNVSAGSVNTPGATIVTVENNHSMIMTASVKETDILKLQEGMKAVVTADALDDQEIPGEVIKVVRVYNGASAAASAGDSGNGNTQTESAASASGYSVQIRLGESALLSGMSAKAKITITDKENILSVPYDLVQENEDGSNYVLCAEENKDGSYTAVKRTVVTGDEVNYYTEIKSGDIEEGDLLIMDFSVSEGDVFQGELLDGKSDEM